MSLSQNVEVGGAASKKRMGARGSILSSGGEEL